MKVAVFTPFLSCNYGTVLQAVAFSILLKQRNVTSTFIRWHYFDASFAKKIFFLLRHPLFLLYLKKHRKNTKNDLKYNFGNDRSFELILKKNREFIQENINVSHTDFCIDTLGQINDEFDKFIVGSDQTWSPFLFYRYSPYFLSFVKKSSKKASYGCSLGTTNIPHEFLSFFKKKIRSFDKISCREKINCNVLSREIQKNISCVLDPTLLLSRSTWEKYFRSIDIPHKYILCYILGEKKCITEYAEMLGAQQGLPVYYIVTRPLHKKHEKSLDGIGCQEFLYLIANCSYLVTDSFHGTIFAINFKRDFTAFNKHSLDNLDNGRLKDVLSLFNLEKNFHEDNDLSVPNPIDYENVEKIMAALRRQSERFLDSIFE